MELAEFGEITSVVVSRGGEIVLEQHLDGEPNALRNTRSATKTIAGSLLGIAIERGLVPGVDARVTHLLGREIGDAQKDAITLRDVLTMSSCLVCLGVALERALGEPLPDFAGRELFVP